MVEIHKTLDKKHIYKCGDVHQVLIFLLIVSLDCALTEIARWLFAKTQQQSPSLLRTATMPMVGVPSWLVQPLT